VNLGFRLPIRPVLLAGLTMLLSCAPGATGAPPPQAEKILWAWERPEDLAFLQPGEARVALLVATITLERDRVDIYSRRQSLRLPPGLRPIPVVRIETRQTSFGPQTTQRLVQELAQRADLLSHPAIQIDFDARASERTFYRYVLEALAARLGNQAEISITALASWCLGDTWLKGAPIAEAVPMLFEMGREGPAIRRRLEQGQDFREPLCRHSYGLATYEPWPSLREGRNLYLFNRKSWSRQALETALEAH